MTRSAIEEDLIAGKTISEIELISDFNKIGIEKGDDVLVHASFSKIGAVKDGPETFISALRKTIGEKGNILMPTSPNASFQLEYIKNLLIFETENEPSRLGYMSEVFRKMDDAHRSASPTEPISVIDPDAQWYIQDHEKDLTPYSKKQSFLQID